jgi:electron transfer flavoprotein beta subunit
MKIIVCVKQVPDSDKVRIDPKTGTLLRGSAAGILNHDDANALEEALKIKEQFPDTHITALSMGPPQAKNILQDCLAMGADEAVLISDKILTGSDTRVTSGILAAAILKLGSFDVIFTGRRSSDGDTAQVGPQIAEKLGIPQITSVKEVEITRSGIVRAKRSLQDGYELLEVKTPCLLTATSELNRPRYMNVIGIYDACEKDIPVWNVGDMGVDKDTTGLEGSPTNVLLTFAPASKGRGVTVKGDTAAEVAESLMDMLQAKHIKRG